MRVLLDQDQVLAEWVEKVLEWYNQDYKTNFTVNDVQNYFDMEKILGPQGVPYIRSCIRYPDFYSDLKPVDGAIEGVKSLIDAGHDVCIVSAVPRCGAVSYHGKLVWLRKFMPWFNLNNFVACSRKELVHGDILLDDAPHNVESYAKSGHGRRAVLFDRPWNQKVTGITRVKTWPEFLEIVKQVQAEKDLAKARAEGGVYG